MKNIQEQQAHESHSHDHSHDHDAEKCQLFHILLA